MVSLCRCHGSHHRQDGGLFEWRTGGVRFGDFQPTPSYATPLLFGATLETSTSYSPFNGCLDDVRLWNVALNGATIRTRMAATLTGSESGSRAGGVSTRRAVPWLTIVPLTIMTASLSRCGTAARSGAAGSADPDGDPVIFRAYSSDPVSCPPLWGTSYI